MVTQKEYLRREEEELRIIEMIVTELEQEIGAAEHLPVRIRLTALDRELTLIDTWKRTQIEAIDNSMGWSAVYGFKMVKTDIIACILEQTNLIMDRGTSDAARNALYILRNELIHRIGNEHLRLYERAYEKRKELERQNPLYFSLLANLQNQKRRAEEQRSHIRHMSQKGVWSQHCKDLKKQEEAELRKKMELASNKKCYEAPYITERRDVLQTEIDQRLSELKDKLITLQQGGI